MKKVFFGCLAALLAVSNAQGQITYVDAVVSGMTGTVNTTGPTQTTPTPTTAWQIRGLNGGPATDTNNFSNGGSALQYATNPIDASNPTLLTTIFGLDAAKNYEVFVFYWDDVATGVDGAQVWNTPTLASAWDIAAKLSTDATYQQFDSSQAGAYVVTRANGLIADDNTNPMTTSTVYNVLRNTVDINGLNVLGQGGDTNGFADAIDGNRAMFAGRLNSQVTGATSFSVNIQASASTAGRSWYDGVGFREIVAIPEPSSIAVLGLMGLVGLARRRR